MGKERTPAIVQAESMSGLAGIELTPDQTKKYLTLRGDKKMAPLSDQQILIICLEPDQQKQFKIRFNI
jgi:hypothetical protein